ncbi:MAG: MFS transporter, partial [Gammaproteobacteria bacterium]
MNSSEKKAVFSLAGIFALRMFGLFLLLPVLSLHASDFSGSTAFLVGMALGVYGLTQAAFQIPVGLLSDKFGRKTLITIGLIV